MNPILKNILITVAAFVAGMAANMVIVTLSFLIIPVEGMDMSDPESFVANAHKLTAAHYVLALLAHASMGLVAAYITGKYATGNKYYYAAGFGILFLFFGYINLQDLPHPEWFAWVDLILCYIPASFLGASIAKRNKNS